MGGGELFCICQNRNESGINISSGGKQGLGSDR